MDDIQPLTREPDSPPECPYCLTPTSLESNAVIYGREYGNGLVFLCPTPACDASIGVHDDGRAKGMPARRELRELRKEGHAAFDQLWKKRGLKRNEAYKLLARELGISREECHWGWFNEERCRKAKAATMQLALSL